MCIRDSLSSDSDWYERAALCGDPSSSGWSTVITNEYVGNILDSYGFDKENASLYTHHTDVAERLSAKYNFVYHPYLMFSGESDAKK